MSSEMVHLTTESASRPIGHPATEDASPPANLNANEVRVLAVLAETANEETCRGFDGIASDAKMERRVVRLACRSLARKGPTRFARGLWTEDGEPAGAGYGPTKQGIERAETDPKCREQAQALGLETLYRG